MVLPRDRSVTIRGICEPARRVEVRFGPKQASGRSDSEGRFAVPLHAGAVSADPAELLITAGDAELRLEDVLVGDVWLCAGQSNMAWPLGKAATAEAALQRADRSDIRLLHLRERASGNAIRYSAELLRDLDASNLFEHDGWRHSDEDSAATFSAVGWFFAERLTANVEVPVGLIQCAVGGAPIEAFLPRERMLADEQLAPLSEDWLDNEDYPGWCRERARFNLGAWFDDPQAPRPHHPFEPSFLYDAGIAPLAEFPIRGVLWYQGESNASSGASGTAVPPQINRLKLVTLIDSLRQQFDSPELPFLFVQLPAHDRPWVAFRAMQAAVDRTVDGTSMAVTIDVGDAKDVHPRRKREVGERLALLALREVYGRNVVAHGPEPRDVRIGKQVRITFHNVDGGLRTADGKAPRGFEFVTAEGEVVAARATLDGDSVVLADPPAGERLRIRYAWRPVPDANLVNDAGLPAAPFLR